MRLQPVILKTIALCLLLSVATCGDEPPARHQPDIIAPAEDVETPLDLSSETPPPADLGPPISEDASPADADTAWETTEDTRDDSEADGGDTGEEDTTLIDPLQDSDGDGVPDLEEIEAGTDPHDPSSAPAWHPYTLIEHPRLFFGPDDLPELRARAKRDEGPHSTLMARLESRAGQTPPAQVGEIFDPLVSLSKARICLAKSFVALMDEDPGPAIAAAELLAEPFPSAATLDPNSKFNLTESQALIDYCTAYDLLAGSDLVAPELIAAARARLIERIDQYRDVTYFTPAHLLVMTLAMNNHPAKADSTLGLCALAINDRPMAAWDINQGLTGMVYVFAEIQAAGGGFAEGWNYLQYGAHNYLPFMAAYHRFAQGTSRAYRNLATFTRHSDPRHGQIIEVLDPAVDPRFREVFETALWTALPDGRLPNTDDANYVALHGGLLAGLFDDPRFLWNWQMPAVELYAEYAEVATFALLDPEMEPRVPDWPLDGKRYEAGFAVFRSDLGPDALWLLIQGEHGPVREHGFGHEHPDEGNILLWYRGEPLLIDPGYINWSHRHLVNQAKDHNLVLVNGEGSPNRQSQISVHIGADAFLQDFDDDPELSTVTMTTEYANTEVHRRVVRSGGRFFVVEDRLAPSDPSDLSPRTYTYRMNGLGGEDVPDGQFELLAEGGRWMRPRAEIDVLVMPTSGVPRYRADREEHATGWGTFSYHAALSVDSDMAGAAGFLSLLLPREAGAIRPEVQIWQAREGVAMARVEFDESVELSVLNRPCRHRGDPELFEFNEGGRQFTVGPGLSHFVFDG